MNEQQTETRIKAAGLKAPRLKPDHIDAVIVDEKYHVFPETCLTICMLTLRNGFTVTGESACADARNFNAEIGRDIAKGNARRRIWALEGYLLREKLHGNGVSTLFGSDFHELAQDHANWSQSQFGSDVEFGPIGPLKHLRKEVDETLEQPHDPMEYADILLLLLDAARRAGINSNDLITHAFIKLGICQQRKWPTPTSNDEPVEHVRTYT